MSVCAEADEREPRIVLLRSTQEFDKCDMDAIIRDLKSLAPGLGFAILKSKQATLSIYIQTLQSRANFTSTWANKGVCAFFTRPRLCTPLTQMSSILGSEEYQDCKMLYFETPSASPPLSVASESCAGTALQSTPPSKNIVKKSHKKQHSLSSTTRTSKPKLCKRVIHHPKKLALDYPLPKLSPSQSSSFQRALAKEDIAVVSPRVFPAPPFYLEGFVEYSGAYGNWTTNYEKFFRDVVVPEEEAYSMYMKWVETTAPKLRCKLLDSGDTEFEEMYYAVCNHPDCHSNYIIPCTECESFNCKCYEVVLDNSWKAKLRRANMNQDWEEAARIKSCYLSGVINEPNLLYKTRVRMIKQANYETYLSQFTRERKVELCSTFCERLFASPGASSCTSLTQLRKNLWAPLRHSSFFLKKFFNLFALPETRINF